MDRRTLYELFLMGSLTMMVVDTIRCKIRLRRPQILIADREQGTCEEGFKDELRFNEASPASALWLESKYLHFPINP